MITEKITIGNEYPLDGLLTIPDTGKASYPAVVLVQGSGSSDMDEKIGGIRPFKDIAEGLARLGVASIRYNKRSFTYGKQMVKALGNDLTVKEEVIEDAFFSANFLRGDSRIDPDKIFIIGHSLGGMLAPRIDAEGGNFAGIIILAGSPRRLEDIMKDQQNEFLSSSKGIIKWIAKKQIKKLSDKLDKVAVISEDEAKQTPFAGKTSLFYLKEMGAKSPAEYLENSTKPVLVMHGEKDLQVLVDKDFEVYKKILANNPNATFKLYPGLNHCFMPSVYNEIGKLMKEYKLERHVEEYVISDIAEWINAHA